jgi:ribosomal protein S20
MPKAKSAEKQARSSERKRIRNQSVKNRIRSGIREFAQLLKGDPKVARDRGRAVVSLLDRAAKNQVMHVNATRRYKARVMAQIQTLSK